MSILPDKHRICILCIVFIFAAINTAQAFPSFTDVPPPPVRPERFYSREDLKRYLQLVHEYYAIIGRPRFGRSLVKTEIDPNDIQLFYMFDTDGDQVISFEEFYDLLGT